MNNITKLQSQYLSSTNDSEKETLLTDLYTNICKLGFYILEKEKYQLQEEDILDIASSIIIRLMEKQQPIIKSAPSAYIKNALFFKQKDYFQSNKPDTLDDDIAGTDTSIEDEIVFNERLSEYTGEILEYADTLSNNNHQLKELIETTIKEQTPYKNTALSIEDLVLRKEYIKAMKSIYYFIKETTNAIKAL